MIDLSRAPYSPKQHQIVGVQRLLDHPAFAILDQVGCGKTLIVVATSQILFERGAIDTMAVICPGSARSTWAEEDPLLGEVAKHAWPNVPNVIFEFHGKYTDIHWEPNALNWVVTNFEFIRREDRLQEFLRALRGRRTWLVIDESWAVKGNSDQTRACWTIRRKRADRVTILNGTPLADGKPLDLYYQFAILNPEIIGVKNRTHFKSKYCVMGGWQGKQVVSYQNLDELNNRIAPFTLSRRTRDCFDLPPMLDPIVITAPLSVATWKIYQEMRDEMATWLGKQASVSRQAIVRILRLSQITSGYLGGLEDVDTEPIPGINAPNLGTMPDWLKKRGYDEPTTPLHRETPSSAPAQNSGIPLRTGLPITREIGREKLDAFLDWLDRLEPKPTKLLVWCRFRLELARAAKALEAHYPRVLQICGGQTPEDRTEAKLALAPGGDSRSAAVVGNQKAGAASLNFAASSLAVYMSNGPALIERTQSLGRIERPGATEPMCIVDVVATGPKGQKTIDHHTLRSLRKKDDMARWTVNEWRRILAEE